MAEKIGFLIVPDFPFYGLFPAIEALRVANYNSGKLLYEWALVSADGAPVTATNGMTLAVDHGIDDCPRLSVCFAVAGNHPLDHCSAAVQSWLRQIDRHGTRLGAFDSGCFLLAAAGLLDGRDAAVHWEIAATLQEHFPAVNALDCLYHIDERRLTCAGGSATLDLVLSLIASAHGPELACRVANGLVHRPHRSGSEPQLHDQPGEHRTDDPLLDEIRRAMQDSIEDPMTILDLASQFGMTYRQIQAIFRKSLRALPSTYMRSIRMQKACEYLFYSNLSVSEIAVACGFSSPAVFCRAFRQMHHMSPREFRRNVSAESLMRLNSSYRHHVHRPRVSFASGRIGEGGYPEPEGHGDGLRR